MSFGAFDIVVVPFPYSDRLAEKRRPALIVSLPEIEQELGRLWLAMITTDRGARQRGDAGIRDLSLAGLPAASVVRASKITTIDVDRILRKAGRLSDRDRDAAVSALKACSAF